MSNGAVRFGCVSSVIVAAAMSCGGSEFTSDNVDASVTAGSAGSGGGSGGRGSTSTGSAGSQSGSGGAGGDLGGIGGAGGGRSGTAGTGGSGGATAAGGQAGTGGKAGGDGGAGRPIDAGPDASPNGTMCTSGPQCATGNCVDGRCCENECATPCYACNLSGSPGLCRPIASGPDPSASTACTGSRTCCSGTCSDTTNVNTCGASCQKCTAPSDRAVPTCNGTSCGYACHNGDPTCSDGTCSRLLWSFDSNALDGILPRMAPGLTVRSMNGNPALAVDVSQLNTISEVSFTIPLCLSGSVNLQAKTFSFRVLFDGPPSGPGMFFVQSSVPTPQTNAYLDQIGVGSGAWEVYSSPMSKSSFSATATSVTIQVGSYGAPFTGTIWFDDIQVK